MKSEGSLVTHSQALAFPGVVRFAKPGDHGTPPAVAIQSGPSAFTSRLSALCQLSVEEVLLLQGLGRSTRRYVLHEEIGADTNPFVPRVVVSGWACRQRILSDGRRQIINLILPGDVIGDLEHPDLPVNDSFVALTPVTTADASALAKALASGDAAYRGLARAVRLMAAQETALLQDQIVRLGRQTAYEKMVHLMLDLHARLQAAGLATRDSFPMPLSQEILSDVLGLSVVHVNRTLSQIRRDGLLERRGVQMKLLDVQALQTVADWVSATTDASVSTSPGRAHAPRA